MWGSWENMPPQHPSYSSSYFCPHPSGYYGWPYSNVSYPAWSQQPPPKKRKKRSGAPSKHVLSGLAAHLEEAERLVEEDEKRRAKRMRRAMEENAEMFRRAEKEERRAAKEEERRARREKEEKRLRRERRRQEKEEKRKRREARRREKEERRRREEERRAAAAAEARRLAEEERRRKAAQAAKAAKAAEARRLAEEEEAKRRIAEKVRIFDEALAAAIEGADPSPRSFANSQYRKRYDALKRGERTDRTVMSAVRDLVVACHGDTPSSREFVAALGREVKSRAGEWPAAQTVWHSHTTDDGGTELCSLLNRALRDDGEEQPETLRPAIRLTRALNAFCVTDDGVASSWPEGNMTWRGTVLPSRHRPFYRVGRAYRAPMFLATSFERSVAQTFMRRAMESASEEEEGEPVMWTFHFDADDHCLHVNYLSTTERELLFTPYSAFRVKSATWRAHPTEEEPHEVALEVAPDNRDAERWPLELRLAPWA